MPAADDLPELEQNTAYLARAVATGDLDRFRPLYERVAPSLYAWACMNILPELRKRVDAQDLTQEVWARALAGFARFDPSKGSFRAWLFGVAKRVLLEGLRNARRGGRHASAFDLSLVPQDVSNISSRLATNESIESFLAHVRDLDREERSLVIYLGLEGLGAAEAAERMGLGREAVTKRWQRLRERLREQGVGGELFED